MVGSGRPGPGVFPRVDLLADHLLYANLILAALGVALMVAAGRGRQAA